MVLKIVNPLKKDNFSKCFFGVFKAFTLAEVLITLAIIGVIAAITIPTLIKEYQKNVAVEELKNSYTTMAQAVKMSENVNGSAYSWNYGANQTASDTLTWFNKYLAPYLKYTSISNDATNVDVFLANGVRITFSMYTNFMQVRVGLNGNKSAQYGKNVFWFCFDTNDHTNTFKPYDYGVNPGDLGTRGYWTNNSTYGCNTSSTFKTHCAGLIMMDGWKIADDYPW